MKTLIVCVLLCFAVVTANANMNYDQLPAEYKTIAAKGLAKLSPENRKWFSNTAASQRAGSFNSAKATRQINARFGAKAGPLNELLLAMMAYQRTAIQERAKDQLVKDSSARLSLNSKAATLDEQNKSITQGMEESKQKADNAMASAGSPLFIGVAAASSATVASAAAQKNPPAKPMSPTSDSPAPREVPSSTEKTADPILDSLNHTFAVIDTRLTFAIR